MDIIYFSQFNDNKVYCFRCMKFLCLKDTVEKNVTWLKLGHRISVRRAYVRLDTQGRVVCQDCYASNSDVLTYIVPDKESVHGISDDPPQWKPRKIDW